MKNKILQNPKANEMSEPKNEIRTLRAKTLQLSFLTKLSRSVWFPFATLFAVVLAMHFNMTVGLADDSIYAAALADKTLWEYSLINYYSWSSRQLVEAVVVYIIHYPLLWRIFDTAMLVGSAICIFKICVPKCQPHKAAWVICALVAMYPITNLVSAGWVVTTVNYLWPLCFGLYSITPLVRISRGERVRWWEYPLCAMATLFAANMEQVAVALIIINIGLLVYNICKRNKKIWYFCVSTLIVIFDIIYSLSCPGSAERTINETNGWFPEFASVPLFRKLEMGFSSTVRDFAMKPNLTFLLFAVLIIVLIFAKTKKTFPRVCSSMPLFVVVAFGFLGNDSQRKFNGFCSVVESVGKYGTAIKLNNVSSWIPEIIMVGLVVSIVVSLWAVFNTFEQKLGALLIITAGFGSRMVMSLSPTIWASGNRTYCFLYFSFYAVMFMLVTKILLPSDFKYKQQLIIFLGFITLACLVNTMALGL